VSRGLTFGTSGESTMSDHPKNSVDANQQRTDSLPPRTFQRDQDPASDKYEQYQNERKYEQYLNKLMFARQAIGDLEQVASKISDAVFLKLFERLKVEINKQAGLDKASTALGTAIGQLEDLAGKALNMIDAVEYLQYKAILEERITAMAEDFNSSN